MTKVTVEIEDVIGQFEKYDDEIRRLREMVKYFACHCGGACDRSDDNCLISQAALGEKSDVEKE